MRLGALDTDQRVVVVAEVGNNHEGDPDVAEELVRQAAVAGAHAVKFQAIDPRRLVRPTERERIAQLDRFRLTSEQFAALSDLAHELGMAFSCTPFDVDAVRWLAPIVDALKIASGDNDLAALLEAVAATGRPVIISSGMSDLAGLRRATAVVRRRWQADGVQGQLAVLHCVSAYPTDAGSARLATIPMLAAELGVTVGYSDHALGIEACVSAVAAGARVLEKHFTLSHDFSDFRDHQLSADPAQLAELVRRVQEVEAMLGEPRTGVLDEEVDVARSARRSIVAALDLDRGHRIHQADLTWLRPRDGLAPGEEGILVGHRLRRGVGMGEPIGADDVD